MYLGSRVSRATLGRTATDDRVGADVCVLHSGKLVGLVETVTKKKEITPYNLHEEFVNSVRSRLDKDARAKRVSGQVSGQSDQINKQQQKDVEGFMEDHCEPDNILKMRKKHSTGTEFQEDHFR